MDTLKVKLTQEQKAKLYSQLLGTMVDFSRTNYPLLTTDEAEALVKDFSNFLHEFFEHAEKEKQETLAS